MGFSRAFIASLLLFLLYLCVAQTRLAFESHSGRALLQQIDCGSACEERCSLASRQKMCKRACGTCCARCNCVPPGTSGNQEMCPCYYNMTTHGNRRKCP